MLTLHPVTIRSTTDVKSVERREACMRTYTAVATDILRCQTSSTS